MGHLLRLQVLLRGIFPPLEENECISGEVATERRRVCRSAVDLDVREVLEQDGRNVVLGQSNLQDLVELLRVQIV